MTLEVNIFHVRKQPLDEDECYHADMIDTLVTDEFYKSHEFDPLNYIFVMLIVKFYLIMIMYHMFLLILRHKDTRTKFQQQQLRNLPLESSPT